MEYLTTDPVTQANETTCFNFLRKTMGYSTAVACGVMANILRESNFKLGASGDNGTSFGLFQWHKERKQNLIDWCNQQKLNHNSARGQLYFFKHELETTEKSTGNKLKSIVNPIPESLAWDAGYWFCELFERPAGGEKSARSRGDLARDEVYPKYKYRTPTSTIIDNTSARQRIVDVARTQLEIPYVYGAKKPGVSIDCSGLVAYAVTQVFPSLTEFNTSSDQIGKRLYDKNWIVSGGLGYGKVKQADLQPGDLICWYTNKASRWNRIGHIGIYSGNGKAVEASSSAKKVVERDVNFAGGQDNYYVYLAGRVQGDGVGSGGVGSGGGSSSVTPVIINISTKDPYESLVAKNLEKLKTDKYEYGYLVDLVNGGEFKFYIPEFSEQAGVQWNPIQIPGRSVDVKAYQSTSSRSIVVNLELFAGVGYYSDGSKDVVGLMHKDVNFVKSLEYPDYSSAILKPPPAVHLILGEAINLQGVVSNVVVKHMKPLDVYNRAMRIDLSFTVTQVATNPPDFKDIRN